MRRLLIIILEALVRLLRGGLASEPRPADLLHDTSAQPSTEVAFGTPLDYWLEVADPRPSDEWLALAAHYAPHLLGKNAPQIPASHPTPRPPTPPMPLAGEQVRPHIEATPPMNARRVSAPAVPPTGKRLRWTTVQEQPGVSKAGTPRSINPATPQRPPVDRVAEPQTTGSQAVFSASEPPTAPAPHVSGVQLSAWEPLPEETPTQHKHRPSSRLTISAPSIITPGQDRAHMPPTAQEASLPPAAAPAFEPLSPAYDPPLVRHQPRPQEPTPPLVNSPVWASLLEEQAADVSATDAPSARMTDEADEHRLSLDQEQRGRSWNVSHS